MRGLAACRGAQASRISCGALPPDGVLEAPLVTADRAAALATFAPAYTKGNGCPTTLIADNLACRDCMLGSSILQEGSWDRCDSATRSTGVNIFAKQLGRVAWTVTAEDQAGHEATADCAVCVDQGERDASTLGQCPKPFTAATACTFGML